MREQHIAKCVSLSETVYNKLRAYMIGSKISNFSEAITNIIVAMVPDQEEISKVDEYQMWHNKQDFGTPPITFEEARREMIHQGYVRMKELVEKQEMKI